MVMKLYGKLALAIEEYDKSKVGRFVLGKDKEFNNKIIKEYCVVDDASLKQCLNTDGHYYECFNGRLCNYFQDLDITSPDDLLDPHGCMCKIKNETIQHLINYLGVRGIVIDDTMISVVIMESPITTKKASYHLIYRVVSDGKNVYFKNEKPGCLDFHNYMEENGFSNKAVDNIYGKNRLLRLVNNSKITNKGMSLKIIEPSDLKDLRYTMGTFIEERADDIIIKPMKIKKKEKKVVKERIGDDFTLVSELLECITQDENSDWETWNKIGMTLYCMGFGSDTYKEYFIQWSASNECKYDAENTLQQWNNYSTMTTYDLTIGTLVYYAKQLNNEKYKKMSYKIFDSANFLENTHTGIAEAFYNIYTNDFIHFNNNWYYIQKYSGIWIQMDVVLVPIHNAIKEMKEMINSSIKGMGKDDEPPPPSDDIKRKIILQLGNVQYKSSIITELKTFYHIKDDPFDTDDNLFAFTNGVYDSTTREFRRAKPFEYVLTTCGYPHIYATSSIANDILTDTFPDATIRNVVLQKLAGALFGRGIGEEIFIGYNLSGSNGKTAIILMIQTVFGGYFQMSNSRILIHNSMQSGETASPGMCAMKNKKFVAFSEIQENCVFSSGTVKSITGRDIISGRKLYEDSQNFEIKAMIMCVSNSPPKFDKIDGGVIRRLRLIPFESEFVVSPTQPHHRKIRDIKYADVRCSFFQLLLEHLIDDIPTVISQFPKRMKKSVDEYLLSVDYTLDFINDYIVADDTKNINRKDLIQLFNDPEVKKEYQLKHIKTSKDFIKVIEARIHKSFETSRSGLILRGYTLGLNTSEGSCIIDDSL